MAGFQTYEYKELFVYPKAINIEHLIEFVYEKTTATTSWSYWINNVLLSRITNNIILKKSILIFHGIYNKLNTIYIII